MKVPALWSLETLKGIKMSDYKNLDSLYIANTYARFPLQIVRGKGAFAIDEKGNKYIDLGTGIGVNALGYSNPYWKKAVKKQLNKVQHTSNLYYTKPCIDLAKFLCEKTGLKKVFFANSGAEANECAIKLARAYGEKKGKDCFNIITLKNSFHGRTITTLSATGQDVFHQKFNPLTQGFLYANANDIKQVETLVKNNNVCGILVECVQGEGGVLPLDKEFVLGLQEICKNNDILFMIDEVQTGNGRCGEYFAYMKFGVVPDVITTAKGLGGGLPIGACIMGEKAKSLLSFGDHGSTYGGNPVACAGALAVANKIDGLLDEVNKKSQIIFDTLKGKSGIESVSGLGLMVGVKTTKPAKDVLKTCMENGVLVLTAKDKVRLLPPLNIPEKVLKKALNVLVNACAI